VLRRTDRAAPRCAGRRETLVVRAERRAERGIDADIDDGNAGTDAGTDHGIDVRINDDIDFIHNRHTAAPRSVRGGGSLAEAAGGAARAE
jgi:hypothetical protein